MPVDVDTLAIVEKKCARFLGDILGCDIFLSREPFAAEFAVFKICASHRSEDWYSTVNHFEATLSIARRSRSELQRMIMMLAANDPFLPQGENPVPDVPGEIALLRIVRAKNAIGGICEVHRNSPNRNATLAYFKTDIQLELMFI